jgi:hypothetical protein
MKCFQKEIKEKKTKTKNAENAANFNEHLKKWWWFIKIS